LNRHIPHLAWTFWVPCFSSIVLASLWYWNLWLTMQRWDVDDTTRCNENTWNAGSPDVSYPYIWMVARQIHYGVEIKETKFDVSACHNTNRPSTSARFGTWPDA
jgi:uncharacterized membrane protein